MTEYADVRIRWLSAAESGRTIPVHLCSAGSRAYKPHFRVISDGQYLGVAFVTGTPEIANPGDECEATVALIYVDTGVDYGMLSPLVEFDVLEGERVIGRGFVARRWREDGDWRKRGSS
jgi:hypothetical protein